MRTFDLTKEQRGRLWWQERGMTNEDEKLARAQAIIVALFLAGCAGQSLPQHVEWVRADGKPLTSQFDRDAIGCRAETQKVNRLGDAGPSPKKAKAIDDVFARCMASRGYIELRQDVR